MWPIITVPTCLSLMRKQMRPFLASSVKRAVPRPLPAFGTSFLPLKPACSVVAAPARAVDASRDRTVSSTTIATRMGSSSGCLRGVRTSPRPGSITPGAWRVHLRVRWTVLVVLVSVAGCGGGEKAVAPTSTPPPATVQVGMRNIKFVPARVTVKVGQTVRWTNQDKVAHTVASAKLKLASEAIADGQSYEYRATKPGRFPYYCTIH